MTKVKVMTIARVAPPLLTKKFCQITDIYYVCVTLKERKEERNKEKAKLKPCCVRSRNLVR